MTERRRGIDGEGAGLTEGRRGIDGEGAGMTERRRGNDGEKVRRVLKVLADSAEGRAVCRREVRLDFGEK